MDTKTKTITKTNTTTISKAAVALFVFVFVFVNVQGQTKKSITVEHNSPVTDELAFDADTKLTVRFLFDEDSNTLSVTLTSPKNLFVFWENTTYRQVFDCWGRFRPDRLPYVATSYTADRFRSSKALRKTLKCPHRKHVFPRWFEAKGLQPVEQQYTLVSDSIVQTFHLPANNSRLLTFRLREVLTLDEVRRKNTSCLYQFTLCKDFNIKYRITIKRNPCLGLDDELTAAQGALAAIKNSYEWYHGKYASHVLTDQASWDDYQSFKQFLTELYPKSNAVSPCPAIQEARTQYNALVDSIQQVEATLDTSSHPFDVAGDHTLNAKTILANSRLLDRTVARFLATTDETERGDLKEQCSAIVAETQAMIAGNRSHLDTEEQHAVQIFRDAEKYFRKVCR